MALEMVALMGAFGGGGTGRIDQLLDKRPDLAKRLVRLDPVVAAATFGGLLTVAELQANGCRIEALVHLALALGRGKQKPNEKFAAELFRHLGDGVCGRMEDPAEDMLVGAVRSPWGNFRVLEGLWEGGSFYLQRFVDVVVHMPPDAGFDGIRRAVVALLQLSETVCDRARLDRWRLGDELPVNELSKRVVSALPLCRRHLRFTVRDLEAIGIDSADLEPFIFDMSRCDALREEPLGGSSLERFPLVVDGGVFCVVLPTAVSAALRYFIVAKLDRAKLREPLTRALALSYGELFAETALLGGARGSELRFAPGPNGAVAETMMRVDGGRYIHFLFYTDPLVDLDKSGLAGINPASMKIGEEIGRRIASACDAISRQEGFRAGLSVVVGCGIGRGAAVAFDREDWPDWRVESCSAYDLTTLSWTPDFKLTTLWRMLDARDRIAALGVRLHNINGLINLVAWVRELDGHLVPHERLPSEFARPEGTSILMIDQNRQRGLRHESATTYDSAVAQFVDGR